SFCLYITASIPCRKPSRLLCVLCVLCVKNDSSLYHPNSAHPHLLRLLRLLRVLRQKQAPGEKSYSSCSSLPSVSSIGEPREAKRGFPTRRSSKNWTKDSLREVKRGQERLRKRSEI